MLNKYFLATVILLISVILTEINAYAQSPIYFINSPDSNIRRITVCNYNEKNDTCESNYSIYYNKNGQLIKETDPESHILIEYKYDSIGKIIEKEELFGESFANGTTKFYYHENKKIEISKAIGFFSEKRLSYENNRVVLEQIFTVNGGMGESMTKTKRYKYDKKNLLQKIDIVCCYYNYNEEPGEIPELKTEILIQNLLESEQLAKETFVETYTYNTKSLLINKQKFNAKENLKLNEVQFEYNQNEQLLKKTELTYKKKNSITANQIATTVTTHAYDQNNQLKTITTSSNLQKTEMIYVNGRLTIMKTKGEKYSSISKYKYEYYKN